MTAEAPDIQAMAQRLTRVERQNRRLKRAGAVVLAGIAAVVLMGQGKVVKMPQWVEGERFVLRDSNGVARAVLGFDIADTVALALLDKKAVARAELMVRGDGTPALHLRDEEGKIVVDVSVAADGAPHLAMYGPRTGIAVPAGRAELVIEKDQPPAIKFINKDEKVVWKAP